MKMKRLLFSIMIVIGSAALLCAEETDFKQVLKKIDEMYTFQKTDFSAEITIVSQKPGEDNETIVVRYFRRDREDKFTMIMIKPDIQKGQGYFSVGDDLWFYDPESRKFAYSSLKDTFQDSDAQNSDFSSSSLVDDYDVTEHSEAKLGQNDVWVMTLVANKRTVAVAKCKMWIRKDNYLLLKQEDYSVSDKLMRTSVYPKYATVEGKFVPLTILIVDNIKVGEKTQMTFANPSVSKLPDNVFNKEYLQQVNQ